MAIAMAPKLKMIAAISVMVRICSSMNSLPGLVQPGSVRVSAARPLVGGRSRRRAEAWAGERLAARAIDQHRIDRLARLRVDYDDARPFGREMLVVPGEQRQQHGTEIAAALGQHIFGTRRPLAITPALEQAARHQRAEPPRQDVGRDVEALLELVEARQALEGVAQNQDAPPFADALEAAGDRALHGAEAFALHGAVLSVSRTMKVT